jgi:predicted ferric reductase
MAMISAAPRARVAGRGHPAVFGWLAALSVLAVVVLWMNGGGVRGLGAEPLTSVGRLTGLVAADLLLLQVLLMARVPPVERAVGQDRLARWHRWAGFTSLHLMVLHVVLIVLGYAASSGSPVLRQTWDLVTTYPGMLLATAALGLFVLVAVTSVRIARRRLRYESWHLLHLYAYLGVGLALPHELWTGADFVASPFARAYWWGLYGVAAGAVLVFRLGLPAWRTVRHRITVEGVVPEGPGVVSVYLRGERLDRLPVRAGQFFVWRFLDGAGWSRGHPFSLSAAPTARRLRITAKDLGDGSRRLAGLRPGTGVVIEGPYGALTDAVRRTDRVTLLACGVGITPLRALLEELPYPPGGAVLLYRARTADDLLFRDELDHIAAARGARVIHLLGPRGTSWLPWGHPPDLLLRLVPDVAASDVYLCGPGPWMREATFAVEAAGVPAAQLHAERFDW